VSWDDKTQGVWEAKGGETAKTGPFAKSMGIPDHAGALTVVLEGPGGGVSTGEGGKNVREKDSERC